MRILFLGNGFDIAHGLPTKYTDFLDFADFFLKCKKGEVYKETDLLEMGYSENVCKYIIPMIIDFKENYIGQICETEPEHTFIQNTLNTSLSDNMWIKYFSKTRTLKGWAGFEGEISRVVQCLDASRKTLKYHEPTKHKQLIIDYKDFPFMRLLFGNDLSRINISFSESKFEELIDTAIKDLTRITIAFELYLSYFVERIDAFSRIPESDIEIAAIDHILTFNYTNTFERLYDEQGKREYDYIHGKARHGYNEFANEFSNIILGIDEYLDEKSRNEDLTFIRFKKFFQRIHNKTSVDYIEWIETIGENAKKDTVGINELFVYGHSLSVTDGDIIRDLLNLQDLTTTIFNYDDDMYTQQIENLVQIIGENALIYAVNHKRIEFKKQHPLC